MNSTKWLTEKVLSCTHIVNTRGTVLNGSKCTVIILMFSPPRSLTVATWSPLSHYWQSVHSSKCPFDHLKPLPFKTKLVLQSWPLSGLFASLDESAFTFLTWTYWDFIFSPPTFKCLTFSFINFAILGTFLHKVFWVQDKLCAHYVPIHWSLKTVWPGDILYSCIKLI